MKQKSNLTKTKLATHLQRFVQNQEGVYSVMMGALGVTLMVVMAFAVDGSGAILDRARLSDSLEQASLALTAENNAHRSDEYALKGRNDRITQELQSTRNRKMVEDYVKSYLPQTKSWEPHTIQCDREATSLTSESVRCRVSGTVARDAWLPFLFNTAASDSKDSGVIRVSNTGVAEKQKSSPPLDIMVVADFSGSMRCLLDYPRICDRHTNRKIDILKSVLTNLTDNVLFKEKDTLTRIGMTSFSLGAAHPTRVGSCVLPYQFNDLNSVATLQRALQNRNSTDILKYFVPNIHVERTIERIQQFDGTDSHYGVTFSQVRNASSVCVGYSPRHRGYIRATDYWFDKETVPKFKQFLNQIEVEGGTLSSAGVLVGANLMMDTNKLRSAEELGSNTQRVMIILSDGKDEFANDTYLRELEHYRNPLASYEYKYRSLMPTLITAGLCDKIRQRFDSTHDSRYPQQRSKLVFIAFGYDPNESNEAAWKQCVGQNNFFVAKQESELLDAFKKAIVAEEIGHSVAP